jgi:cellulose biosynthesis protein BcsQ
MVLGTPGSGKTTAIVSLVKILAKMKQRVLLVNFTNQAIDNVLIRLKDSGFNSFVRVTNNINSVDSLLHDKVKTHHMFDNMDQIRAVFDTTYVFGTTCL